MEKADTKSIKNLLPINAISTEISHSSLKVVKNNPILQCQGTNLNLSI